ncbi:MAG TPA: hypothetical protein VIA62_25030 [Thermoanaerobaculia bacterium]|jgi:hypothetical protein|nr:hypothetical protein [Thermoanaerobaculia bacterium]
MKKRVRKLSLHRETLLHLQSNGLRAARGGTGNTNEIMTGCACTDTCLTDVCGGCGTNSCGCGSDSCGCGSTVPYTCGGC